MERQFEKFENKIIKLRDGKLNKENILNQDFLLNKNGNMKIYYAPHNEYTNVNAKVVIVGICPGWTQTELAYQQAKFDLGNSIDTNTILKNCKKKARFAGSMRNNLINMLDELKLPQKLNTNSTSELFEDNEIMHTTSLIPYPVFINGKNYNGHTPLIMESKFLMQYVRNHFFKEIINIDKPLIIPLGKAVEDILNIMIKENIVSKNQCLFGFPHPSGANGHRKEQFIKNKEELIILIDNYFR